MRIAWVLLPILALTAASAEGAESRRFVVVLDRGIDATRGAAGDSGNALRLLDAMGKRELEATLLAAGSDARGRAHILLPEPSESGISDLAKEGPFTFRGPTDPRDALARILKDLAQDAEEQAAPIDVVFIGPFSAPKEPASKDQRLKVIQAWNDDAPAGSRIFPISMSAAARASLEGASGLLGKGQIVINAAAPTAATAAFSPLAPSEVPLTARVRVLVDLIRVGDTPEGGVVLGASSDVAEDQLETKTMAGVHDFHVRRRSTDGRTGTISFKQLPGDGALWLCAPPKPLTFRWETLRPDARLVGPSGVGTPPFAAMDIEVGSPYSVAYRLQRSLSGPTRAWGARTQGGPLPAGMRVTFGEETRASSEIAETEVRVSLEAAAGRPVEAQGVILFQADGMPDALHLPYDVRVQPGRGVLTVGPTGAVVPAAVKDKLPTVQIEAKNANLPSTVLLEVHCPGEQRLWLTAFVRSPEGGVVPWSLQKRHELPVGAPRTLTFELSEGAPAELAWPCVITIRPLPRPGIEVTGGGTLSIRLRKPRLNLRAPAPSLLVIDGEVVAEHPIVLELDADGGDGEWLLGLLSKKPTVSTPDGAPVDWEVVGQEAGTWLVQPRSPWKGISPRIFRTVEQSVSLDVRWAAGTAPGTIEVPVGLTPRWGKKGYILVVLAGLAILLALLIFLQMRSASLSGTLIYTVEGLEGTVGRLDLSSGGRGVAVVRSDERGRLTLQGKGSERIVVRVLPTRVGGLLEVPGSATGRRLLVDGLSLRVGRHLLRYVSGQPQAGEAAAQMEEVPDLLGPEFDIDSGRIEGLEEKP